MGGGGCDFCQKLISGERGAIIRYSIALGSSIIFITIYQKSDGIGSGFLQRTLGSCHKIWNRGGRKGLNSPSNYVAQCKKQQLFM